jgi:hypothetical protein
VIDLARPVTDLIDVHANAALVASRDVTAPGLLDPGRLEHSARMAGTSWTGPTKTSACSTPSSVATTPHHADPRPRRGAQKCRPSDLRRRPTVTQNSASPAPLPKSPVGAGAHPQRADHAEPPRRRRGKASNSTSSVT